MDALKLYARFIPAYFKSKNEYGFYFYADFLAFSIINLANYLVIWVMFEAFPSINGWSYYEVLFLYTMNLFTYGVAGVFFFFQLREMETMVQEGTFDSILIRPVNPFIHIVIRTFGHFFLGDVVIGIVMFAVCFKALHLEFTFVSAIGFGAVLLGAILIQAAFMIVTGAASFWFIKSNALTNVVLFGLRSFLNYPISIYGKGIQMLLTFIVPYAFVNFYPSQLFLQKKGDLLFHPVLQFATPAVGLLLFWLSYRIWAAGINKYQGAGN